VSLRARLLVGMCLVAVVLGVAAVVVTRSTEAHLIAQVDAQLEAVEHRPGSRLGGGPPGQNGDQQPPPAAGDDDSDRLSSLYVAIVAADGTVAWVATPNLSADDPPRPALDGDDALAAAASDRGPFTLGSEGSDTRYRALARPEPGSDGAEVVATSLADVDDAVSRLMLVQVAAVLGVLAVLGLVAWWVIRLGVRPLKTMTATARDIADGDLSRRVPDVAPGTEAGELGTALNRMLARIEAEFDERVRSEARLRQFAADASHELRTPVATIRGYAELFRAGALDDRQRLVDGMRRTEEEAVRMGALIDDLLHLVRYDHGRPLAREPVDLAALADDGAGDAAALQPARPITTAIHGPITVLGDEARLRQVVANLVGNALVHTPASTPVAVRVDQEDDRAVLEIADEGPGMGEEAASRAFERFYRADPSRSRHHGGTGLGLAIVDATVRAHGGDVTLASRPGAGTTVRVELPLATAAAVTAGGERRPRRAPGRPGRARPRWPGPPDRR
jgi:two-component system, OmpR family, sensor kinase